MNKLIFCLLFMTVTIAAFSQSKKQKPPIAKTAQIVVDIPSHIMWTNMTDALAKSGKTRKKILVDFYTDWCGWCKRMDKATYENPKVIEMVNKYYLPVKFNAEAEGPIKYKGEDFSLQPQGIRSTHTLAIKLLDGQMGYPSTTFLNSDHSRITNQAGYIEAGEMVTILKYFGENKHLDMSYEEFKKQEVSNIQ